MNGALPEALLEAFPFGLAVLDPEGRIVQVNREAARRLERGGDGPVGADFFEAIASGHSFDNARNAFLAGAVARRVSIDIEAVGAHVRLRGFETADGFRVLSLLEPEDVDDRDRGIAEAWEAAIELASDVRHGINNPLMVIMGQIENLLMRSDLPALVRQRLGEMHHEALRIRDLVARLQEIRRK